MFCIKCKKEIDDKSLRCVHCNTKVQTVCPICKNLNPLKSEFCSGCGLQLLKYCPACNRANLPSAPKCRKCEFEFEENIAGLVTKEDDDIAVVVEMPVIAEPSVVLEPEQTIEIEEPKIDTPPNRTIEPVEDNTLHSLSAEADEITELSLDEDYDEMVELEPLEDLTEETNQISIIKREEDKNDKPETAGEPMGLIDTSESTSSSPFDDLSSLVDGDTDDVVSIEVKEETEEAPEPVQENIEETPEEIEPVKLSEPAVLIPEEIIPEPEPLPTINLSSSTLPPETLQNEDEPKDSLINETVYDQSKCKNLMSDAVRSTDKLIIGLSAEEGTGKSTVFKYLFNDLINQNYNWLWGECSANSQISPYGIFQEMLLTFFNCPNFTNLSPEFKTNAQLALQNFFEPFDPKDIDDLFNFLYPTAQSHFETILTNKDITFNLIEKTLVEISKKAKLIITIDDFDMIDGASYEFLVQFIENGNLNENLKLIIGYKDKRIAQGYFYSEKIRENQYQDVRLGKLTKEYADNLIKMYLNGTNPLPEELFNDIYNNSNGNSAYIEQILILLNENEAFYSENKVTKYKSTPIELDLPKNIYEVLTLRLNLLQKNFPMVYKTLCTAAIMGNKFNLQLLELIMKMNTGDFQNIVQMLTNSAYISQFNNTMYIFKNTLLWKIIYEKAKQSPDFVTLNEKIFDVINSYVLSSNALKALIAQNLNQKLLALTIWTDNIKLCAHLGDEHLWVLSQKQSLKIIQEVTPENNQLVINNIYERLGKLLYISKPADAITYLSYALVQAIKVSNIPKTIELSGYLSKSCTLTGNYHGVIEAIDTVLKLIDKPENKLECALIKYKKLKAMFSIGNSEEIFNLASNEIIPIIEQALSRLIPTKNIPIDIIYETWLETNLIVANALSIQGNNKCFQILSLIDEIIAKNNVENKNYLHRVSLSKALAYSIAGDIQKSEEILIEVNQKTSKETVEPEIVSQWNFINILNKLLKRDWGNIKEDMYSVVTFANNYNDVLVKNLLKIFLGKVLQEEGSLAKALDIYNEQVTVFAKEKIAIGALLCWYYIAKITLVTDGSDKALDIAQKALEVAKNPKITNYYFMVMYKKLIAEIFIIKGDLEAAKMYIEKALLIVKNYDMKLQKVLLYQLYGKYLEEMVNKKPKNKVTYAQNALNTYKKALTMVQDLKIPAIEEDVQKNLSSFKAFCQLNGIRL